MNDNTMHKLHDAANDTLVRRLQHEMSGLCSGAGGVCQAIEAPAGSAPTGTDTPGAVEAGRDIDGNQGAGVKA